RHGGERVVGGAGDGVHAAADVAVAAGQQGGGLLGGQQAGQPEVGLVVGGELRQVGRDGLGRDGTAGVQDVGELGLGLQGLQLVRQLLVRRLQHQVQRIRQLVALLGGGLRRRGDDEVPVDLHLGGQGQQRPDGGQEDGGGLVRGPGPDDTTDRK